MVPTLLLYIFSLLSFSPVFVVLVFDTILHGVGLVVDELPGVPGDVVFEHVLTLHSLQFHSEKGNFESLFSGIWRILLFPLKRKSVPKKGEFQNDCQQILESEIFKYILEKRKRGRLKAKFPFVEFHKVEYNRDQASSPEVDVCKEGGESSARFRC